MYLHMITSNQNYYRILVFWQFIIIYWLACLKYLVIHTFYKFCLGASFNTLGLGYFCGLLFSLQFMEYNYCISISKTAQACICIYITGVCQALIIFQNTLMMIKILVFFGFFGMGGVDTLSTIALSEMWGQVRLLFKLYFWRSFVLFSKSFAFYLKSHITYPFICYSVYSHGCRQKQLFIVWGL